jgi:hypothetical protein
MTDFGRNKKSFITNMNCCVTRPPKLSVETVNFSPHFFLFHIPDPSKDRTNVHTAYENYLNRPELNKPQLFWTKILLNSWI